MPLPSWARTLRELNVRDGRSKKAQVVRDSEGDGGIWIGMLRICWDPNKDGIIIIMVLFIYFRICWAFDIGIFSGIGIGICRVSFWGFLILSCSWLGFRVLEKSKRGGSLVIGFDLPRTAHHWWGCPHRAPQWNASLLAAGNGIIVQLWFWNEWNIHSSVETLWLGSDWFALRWMDLDHDIGKGNRAAVGCFVGRSELIYYSPIEGPKPKKIKKYLPIFHLCDQTASSLSLRWHIAGGVPGTPRWSLAAARPPGCSRCRGRHHVAGERGCREPVRSAIGCWDGMCICGFDGRKLETGLGPASNCIQLWIWDMPWYVSNLPGFAEIFGVGVDFHPLAPPRSARAGPWRWSRWTCARAVASAANCWVPRSEAAGGWGFHETHGTAMFETHPIFLGKVIAGRSNQNT